MALRLRPPRSRSSAPRPVGRGEPLGGPVFAHRGASGYRPEHTLAAYRTAFEAGADGIEVDVVISADGVLVARHENELSASTDVACRPEFAHRRRTTVVDGQIVDGWFVEDFTVAELGELRARERMPALRPLNTTYDGTQGIATLGEVLALVRAESLRARRVLGVLVELKHVEHAERLGLCPRAALADTLRRYGVDTIDSGVRVMAMEPTALQGLAGTLQVPLVQLLGRRDREVPGLDGRRFGDLAAPGRLSRVADYATAVGVHTSWVLPRSRDGQQEPPTRFVERAQRHHLDVWAWTLRAENRFLPRHRRQGRREGQWGDLAGFAAELRGAGVTALITDHPDRVRATSLAR